MVRIGVVGYGYWGPNLVRNFFKLANCSVLALADCDPAKTEAVQRIYPSVRTFSDSAELLQCDDLDAVAISTPTSTHYSLVKAALLSGKHVWVEKPMAASVAQAEELVHTAEQKRRILMVDHTFVYTGAVQKIRELLCSGEVGEVYYYDSVRVNLGLFRHDENVLWDLGPHDFSVMLYLLNQAPTRVSAIGARPIGWDGWNPESIVYVTVWLSKQTLAHFHLNWLSPVKVRRTLIGGSNKMIVYDHLDPDNQVKIFDKGVDVGSTEERYRMQVQYRAGDMIAPKVNQSEALEVACAHFVDCIAGGKEPLTDGRAGLDVVRLLEAAQESLNNAGKSVEVEAYA